MNLLIACYAWAGTADAMWPSKIDDRFQVQRAQFKVPQDARELIPIPGPNDEPTAEQENQPRRDAERPPEQDEPEQEEQEAGSRTDSESEKQPWGDDNPPAMAGHEGASGEGDGNGEGGSGGGGGGGGSGGGGQAMGAEGWPKGCPVLIYRDGKLYRLDNPNQGSLDQDVKSGAPEDGAEPLPDGRRPASVRSANEGL
jgi:hypothetical protein